MWPDDLIREILLRLPVKSLLRFKCVCRHWHALIGSPSFINEHYGHESNQERLLIQYHEPREYADYALYVDETFSAYEMPIGISDHMGPLNGIYCVRSCLGRMALLNPAMRQFKPLPLLRPDVDPNSRRYHDVLGFGFDPLNGDYKVVSIHYVGRHSFAGVSIYDSSGDSWRSFDDVDLVNSGPTVCESLCNTYLNGVYYWPLECIGNADVAILAFDMSAEKFHKVQVPGCVCASHLRHLVLCGDSLALLTRRGSGESGECFEVWMMKNEGCWIKSSRIGPFPDISRPLCFWKNDELLLVTSSSLALCNVSTKKLRAFDAPRKDCYIDRAFIYRESLVSIRGEGDECKLWDTSSDFIRDFFKIS